jgi:hypothetical protein
MRADQTPFPVGWVSVELQGYREIPQHGTYSIFRLEDLPPVPAEALREDFQWLRNAVRDVISAEHEPESWKSQFNQIVTSASACGLSLPETFKTFMSSYELRGRIRSSTDCFFELPDRIVEFPPGDNKYLIKFLSDSQGCLFWYLYLDEAGEHCVVASDLSFGSDWDAPEPSETEQAKERILFCSPSFAEFIYRFWIENEIWFVLSDEKKLLTNEQQRYLDHYR